MNLLNIFQIYLKGSLTIIIFHIKVYLIARNFPLNENSQHCFQSLKYATITISRDKGITFLFFF